jgi:hypothetical protein
VECLPATSLFWYQFCGSHESFITEEISTPAKSYTRDSLSEPPRHSDLCIAHGLGFRAHAPLQQCSESSAFNAKKCIFAPAESRNKYMRIWPSFPLDNMCQNAWARARAEQVAARCVVRHSELGRGGAGLPSCECRSSLSTPVDQSIGWMCEHLCAFSASSCSGEAAQRLSLRRQDRLHP